MQMKKRNGRITSLLLVIKQYLYSISQLDIRKKKNNLSLIVLSSALPNKTTNTKAIWHIKDLAG